MKGLLHEIFPRSTAILSQQSKEATRVICYLSLHNHKIHHEKGAVNIQNSRSIDQLKHPIIYDV